MIQDIKTSVSKKGRLVALFYTKDESFCCRANMAHTRQLRPDYGLDFQIEALFFFKVVPSSLRLVLLQQHSRVSLALICLERCVVFVRIVSV